MTGAAYDQYHQLALGSWDRITILPQDKIGDQFVKLLFFLAGREGNRNCFAVGVFDVSRTSRRSVR